MISKVRFALFFGVCNVLFLVLRISRYIYTSSQIFVNFDRPVLPGRQPDFIWRTISSILLAPIYIGFAWLMTIFKEKPWIRLSVALFVLMNLITMALVQIDNAKLFSYAVVRNGVNAGTAITVIYMYIAMFCVQSANIKWYFRVFVISTIVAEVLTTAGQYIYYNFRIKWVLLSTDVAAEICILLPFLLFLKVYTSILRGKTTQFS
jgi:hypothetical protein